MDWNARVRRHLTVGEDEVIEELAQHARTEYETARAEGCSTAVTGSLNSSKGWCRKKPLAFVNW
jgi:hypothetical protein